MDVIESVNAHTTKHKHTITNHIIKHHNKWVRGCVFGLL